MSLVAGKSVGKRNGKLEREFAGLGEIESREESWEAGKRVGYRYDLVRYKQDINKIL